MPQIFTANIWCLMHKTKFKLEIMEYSTDQNSICFVSHGPPLISSQCLRKKWVTLSGSEISNEYSKRWIKSNHTHNFRYLWCFLFYQRMCTLFQKMEYRVCFLKMFRPLKQAVCFILNNLHFPMVEGIAFYALHKSRVLIIPCKADGFCLFIGLPDEI